MAGLAAVEARQIGKRDNHVVRKGAGADRNGGRALLRARSPLRREVHVGADAGEVIALARGRTEQRGRRRRTRLENKRNRGARGGALRC